MTTPPHWQSAEGAQIIRPKRQALAKMRISSSPFSTTRAQDVSSCSGATVRVAKKDGWTKRCVVAPLWVHDGVAGQNGETL